MIKKLLYYKNLNVLDDYLDSLCFFDDVQDISTLKLEELYNENIIFFITQVWFDEIKSFPFDYTCKIYYINVEMLSEHKRLNHVLYIISKNIPIIDYSVCNIKFMHHYLTENKIPYDKSSIIHLPYQFNHTENIHLTNSYDQFEYDVGIINAYPALDENNTSKRTTIYEKLINDTSFKTINIVGWGRDRDRIISKCKIIVNVHHFDCFKIFEDIRCARLVFAGKIIISDESLFQNDIDLEPFIYWTKYNDIIPKISLILANFEYYNSIQSSKNRDINAVIDQRKNNLSTFLKKKTCLKIK